MTNTTITKKTVHFAPNYFVNPTHPITIALVGCGGTGSLVMARLARMDYALRKLNHPGIHLIAFDNDTVEENNVGRQNFSPFDVGQNKALCLVEKINHTYGLQWEAIPKKIKSSLPKTNIVISAVDNAKFRMDLYNLIKQYIPTLDREYNTPYYWLDLGNGNDFGQAIIGTIQKIKQPTSEKFNTTQELQNVVDLYGDIAKYDTQEKQGMQSCSFIDSITKQDLFINDAIAVDGCAILWKLFKNFFIEYNAVFINQQNFNAKATLLSK